jgi:hypothetical protein
MSVPCNKQDFDRFDSLANILANQKPPVEISIYVSEDKGKGTSYVSIEMNGSVDSASILPVFEQ